MAKRKKFSEIIRERRKELGLTQREVAQRIGATAAYISILESNRELPPPRPTVEALAAALELDPEELWAAALAERKERFLLKAHGRSTLARSRRRARREPMEVELPEFEEGTDLARIAEALKEDPEYARACSQLLAIFSDVRRRHLIGELLEDIAKLTV